VEMTIARIRVNAGGGGHLGSGFGALPSAWELQAAAAAAGLHDPTAKLPLPPMPSKPAPSRSSSLAATTARHVPPRIGAIRAANARPPHLTDRSAGGADRELPADSDAAERYLDALSTLHQVESSMAQPSSELAIGADVPISEAISEAISEPPPAVAMDDAGSELLARLLDREARVGPDLSAAEDAGYDRQLEEFINRGADLRGS